MKIAIISDIHGNLYALLKALEDINEQNIDKIICLGDLTGYGPHPNEVIALIKRRNSEGKLQCIKGNYDASVVDGDYTFIRNTTINSFALPWAVKEVRISNKYYLDSLPLSITENINGVNFMFTHGSPNKINEYLFEDAENTANIMASFENDVLVCGHTHIPFAKKFGNKTLINAGSIGKPKIGRPNLTYTIINISDSGELDISFREIEYEYKRVMKDCSILEFPNAIIDSYRTGQE